MLETHLRKDRQTLKLGLIKVTHDLFPAETFETVCSIPNGVFCQLVGSALSEREVKKIELALHKWVAEKQPIQLLSDQDGYYHYKVNDLIIKTIHPTSENSALADQFRILPFFGGYVVDFSPNATNTTFSLPRRLSSTYGKSQLWLSNIKIELVSDVNNYIKAGRYQELINIAEALQEKEIADIADMVMRERRAVKVILIAGPSSSGKTTFSHRLSTQLRVNGLRPVPLALDDYFVNREFTPKDEKGNYDFDAVEALDLDLLDKHLEQLVNGEKIQAPLFDFQTGCRLQETRELELGNDGILVLEGIHALNPALISNITKSVFFRIYVSALFGLNIDYLNRIPTTDVRLIRRMVRDEKFRGFMPERTMSQWPSVRRGERKHIFKFQEECDVMFNSSLIYEMNALKPFAEHALNNLTSDSVHYETKQRLLRLLSFFEPIDHSQIPFNSILREFIGGNIFPPSEHDYNLFLHSQRMHKNANS
ncbi:MAG TPA: nucleoside kinase [Candidatus Avacidaminococcus intestinavium]|uniref:Nucleoside kinase n=1 Tax=Candidatus Avacidaminococcus intestinavium TaxID=2840684 RepID=A0A9D1MR56_9FIRM|nr:nucleoside kinase [Candidatus Avacidaminococcus intestinavium]